MDADEFRDYMLGFIFYRYLSERLSIYADKLLEQDKIKFDQINENTSDGKDILEAIREEAVTSLGYFLKPSELFHKIVEKGNSQSGEHTSNFIDELGDIWYYIRILCYQRDYQPTSFLLLNLETDELIAMAIQEAANAFLSYKRFRTYSVFCIDTSYSVLLLLLRREGVNLDELTELNWEKLQPGSERGEQWMKARR